MEIIKMFELITSKITVYTCAPVLQPSCSFFCSLGLYSTMVTSMLTLSYFDIAYQSQIVLVSTCLLGKFVSNYYSIEQLIYRIRLLYFMNHSIFLSVALFAPETVVFSLAALVQEKLLLYPFLTGQIPANTH